MKQEIKNDQYRRLMTALEADYGACDMARWFGLGDSSNTRIASLRSHINRKLATEDAKWHRNTSAADVFLAEVLAFMDAEGYDLNRIERDEDGRLLSIAKRPFADRDRQVLRVFNGIRQKATTSKAS